MISVTCQASTTLARRTRTHLNHVLLYRGTNRSPRTRTSLISSPPRSGGVQADVRWHASSSSSGSNSSTTTHIPLTTNASWTVYPKSFSVGTLAGLLGSLAGMGGGFVMIPIMTSRWLKLTQHQAHGTSLFAVMATGAAGAFAFEEQVQWDAAAAVAACGMVSARMGARATGYLSGPMLRKLLGALMLLMAPAIPVKACIMDQYSKKQKQRHENQDKDHSKNKYTATSPLSVVASRLIPPAMIGIVSGFLAGVFGVGGGVIVVPALTIALDMNHYQALGTSLAAMTPPAAVGVYTHYRAGNVVLRVAPTLALGAFCGAYLGGSMIGLKTDETTLRWGFSGLLTVLGIRTILKA